MREVQYVVEVATNFSVKFQPVLYPKHVNAKGRLLDRSLSFLFMKKLTIFILILLLLIVSEYVLLNELFAHNMRVGMVLLSLLSTVIFILVIVRFFKKYILPAKQS